MVYSLLSRFISSTVGPKALGVEVRLDSKFQAQEFSECRVLDCGTLLETDLKERKLVARPNLNPSYKLNFSHT